MNKYRARQLVVALTILFWLFVLGLCSGCGGGGSDEEQGPDQFIGPPDCKARPELCT